MYPKNSASPPRIVIGAVILIADGTVQTSGVTVTVRGEGGAEAGSGGTIAYGTGIVYYTPTQAETNHTAFIVIASKSSCIPVAQTIITTDTATPGRVAVTGTKSDLDGLNDLAAGAEMDIVDAPNATAVTAIQSGLATPTNITAATGIVLSGVTHTNAVIPSVTLTDTVTTYTGNTLQTADVAALITTVGVAGAGLTAIAAVGDVTNLSNLPTIPTNWITAAGINADAITSAKIADNAFLAVNFGADFITSAKIANDAFLAVNFAASSLDGKGDWNTGKTGYSLTATTGLGAQTANITGNLSGSVGSVTAGVTLAAGAVTDASLAGGLEIVFETDFGTNYNVTRNAWVNNYTDIIGTMDAAAFGADFLTSAKVADGAFVAANFAASSLDGKGDWNTTVPDAAGVAPTAVENRQEMDSNSTVLATIATDTTTDIPALIADLQTDLDTLTDTSAEPTGVPAASATLLTKVGYLYMALRNQVDVTATKKTFYGDDAAAEWEKDLSDDATTYSESEGNAI